MASQGTADQLAVRYPVGTYITSDFGKTKDKVYQVIGYTVSSTRTYQEGNLLLSSNFDDNCKYRSEHYHVLNYALDNIREEFGRNTPGLGVKEMTKEELVEHIKMFTTNYPQGCKADKEKYLKTLLGDLA